MVCNTHQFVYTEGGRAGANKQQPTPPTETWPQAESDVVPSHLKHGPAGPTVSSLLSYSGPMPGTTQVPVEARRYVEHDNVCLVSTSVT